MIRSVIREFWVVFVTTVSITTACARPTAVVSTVEAGTGSLPTPISSLMEHFVWQTDGLFGYHMLRPANWDSINLVDYRGYTTPGFAEQADRILVRVVNLQTSDESSGTSTGLTATLALFEKEPSLEGWTEGIEQNWQSNGIESTLLRTLPEAKLYSVRSPSSSDVQIVAYSVDRKQPIAIDLTASGIYADIDYLQQKGILDDFIAMVESVQAIPQNPQNIKPPLK